MQVNTEQEPGALFISRKTRHPEINPETRKKVMDSFLFGFQICRTLLDCLQS